MVQGNQTDEGKIVIFTDLDRTLLDENYGYQKALPAVKLVQKRKIPLLFCSSKTKAELEWYRKELGISDPFISENGGAVFIPKDYYSFDFTYDREDEDYLIIELGTRYALLREVLMSIRNEVGVKIIGYGDLLPKEVARDTGLSIAQAKLAIAREYDEPFKIRGEKDIVLNAIRKRGFDYIKGSRYYHLVKGNGKGKATKVLLNLFKREYKERVRSIGLGDAPNDYPMLSEVDIPLLIQKPSVGWNRAVKNLLSVG